MGAGLVRDGPAAYGTGVALSVFDLFSIGIGPSSSHTVGPMRAALAFAEGLDATGLLEQVARVRVDLYGSLGSTGKGHQSDRAVILGLLGNRAEEVDPASVKATLKAVEADRRLALLGRHEIAFKPEKDLVLHLRKALPGHPNGMLLRAYGRDRALLAQRTMYSIGGGFVVDEADLDKDLGTLDATPVPHPFSTAEQLLARCDEEGKTIDQLVLENELARRPEAQVRAGILHLWAVMQECVANGTATQGRLPGGLKVLRRAPLIKRRLMLGTDPADPLAGMDWVTLYALAVNEENAAGGRVVTAPTNGAAGVIPAVLQYYRNHVRNATDDGVIRFLLVATAIGSIIKESASISGAEVGCQGEVGSACAMAAAGMAAVMGGTPWQVENAAEIGMEHNLGLTCDPVNGLVQVPCIERNAIAAIKAIAAARTAMRGTGEHLVSLDTVIKTMRDTGRDMLTKYKETSRGGLAVNVIEC